MPKMDGFALCERLKKVDPDVKVCFLTSSEMYYEKIRGIKHYALNKDLFLQKPISTDDLIRGNKQEDKLNSISNRGIKQGNSVVSQLQP
jgi:CheY-like chemotaxis protein